MSLLDCISWFNRPARVKIPKDHWEECEKTMYVYDYRDRLDKLAVDLQGDSGSKVYTRFNPKLKAAEILSDRHGIIATVKVRGEVGYPYEAVISLKQSATVQILQEKFQELFGKVSVKFLTM